MLRVWRAYLEQDQWRMDPSTQYFNRAWGYARRYCRQRVTTRGKGKGESGKAKIKIIEGISLQLCGWQRTDEGGDEFFIGWSRS